MGLDHLLQQLEMSGCLSVVVSEGLGAGARSPGLGFRSGGRVRKAELISLGRGASSVQLWKQGGLVFVLHSLPNPGSLSGSHEDQR